MTYLITGISGFVGGHYVEHLLRMDPDTRIIGVDAQKREFAFLKDPLKKKIEFHQGTLLNKDWFLDIIKRSRPDYIVNLASYSSVAYSWKSPAECFVNNTNIFLNIIEAVRRTEVNTKILSVGSSEEYGTVKEKELPLTEKSRLDPTSPYAVARIAQEHLSQIYAEGYKIPVICTRSFNHIGPRQKEIFVVSSFAKQIIEAKMGKRDKIVTGDLGIVRDFIDVRDVVRAYDLLLRKGKIGEVYNVCSGKGHKLSDVLAALQEEADTDIAVLREENLIRPIDNPVIVGSCEKLCEGTGFKAEYSLPRSLKDTLEYWQVKLENADAVLER